MLPLQWRQRVYFLDLSTCNRNCQHTWIPEGSLWFVSVMFYDSLFATLNKCQPLFSVLVKYVELNTYNSRTRDKCTRSLQLIYVKHLILKYIATCVKCYVILSISRLVLTVMLCCQYRDLCWLWCYVVNIATCVDCDVMLSNLLG